MKEGGKGGGGGGGGGGRRGGWGWLQRRRRELIEFGSVTPPGLKVSLARQNPTGVHR